MSNVIFWLKSFTYNFKVRCPYLILGITHVSVDGPAESPLVDAGAVVESEQRLEWRAREDELEKHLPQPSAQRKMTHRLTHDCTLVVWWLYYQCYSNTTLQSPLVLNLIFHSNTVWSTSGTPPTHHGRPEGDTHPPPPPWNLKTMTSYAVSVQSTLKFSLAPSRLASDTLKSSPSRRKNLK